MLCVWLRPGSCQAHLLSDGVTHPTVLCTAGIDIDFTQRTATMHIAAHDYEFSLHKLTGGRGRNETAHNQPEQAARLEAQLKAGPLTAVVEVSRTADVGSGGYRMSDTLWHVACGAATQGALLLGGAPGQQQEAHTGRRCAVQVSGEGCDAMPSRGPGAVSMAIPQHPEQRSVKITWHPAAAAAAAV